MKLTLAILIISISSCQKNIDSDDLYSSKWSIILEDNYYEMWFFRNQALMFNPYNNVPQKFKFMLKGDVLEFFYLNDNSTDYAYSYKIKSLNGDDLILKSIENEKMYYYNRIKSSSKKFSLDDKLDSYFKEYNLRLDSSDYLLKPETAK